MQLENFRRAIQEKSVKNFFIGIRVTVNVGQAHILANFCISFAFQIKVWDVQEKKCIAVLMGHTGSVKSMSPHPTNPGMSKFLHDQLFCAIFF